MQEREAFLRLNFRRILGFLGKSAKEYLGLVESSNPCNQVNQVLRGGFDDGRYQ